MYVYDYYNLCFNCVPFTFNGKYRVVIEDYVMMQNGKKYYQFSGWWQGGSVWRYQRIDSNTMNVYGYDTMLNSEVLLDSLLVNSGNSFNSSRFNRQNPNASCHGVFTDTIFGTPRVRKELNSYYISIGFGYSIAEGIGFLGVSSCELGSGPSYSLKGCTIDGVVYGDTLLTGIQTVNSSL